MAHSAMSVEGGSVDASKVRRKGKGTKDEASENLAWLAPSDKCKSLKARDSNRATQPLQCWNTSQRIASFSI